MSNVNEFMRTNDATRRFIWVHPEPVDGYVVCDVENGNFGLDNPDSKYYYLFFYQMLEYAERRGYAGICRIHDPLTDVLFICPFEVFDTVTSAKHAATRRNAAFVYNLATGETITL